MKFSIADVSQQALIDNGLDVIDAIILTWFSDFIASGDMKWVIKDGNIYYWLLYKKLMEELPAIGIKERHGIARRFAKYEKIGIVEKYVLLEKGTFTYFRLTSKWYSELKSSVGVNSKVPGGGTQKFRPGELESSDKDSLSEDSPQEDSPQKYKEANSENTSHSKDELNSNSNTQSPRFAPPTPAQVDEYIASSRRLAWRDKWGVPYPGNINGEAFVNYYEARGWFAGKAKMKSWQAALRTWEQSAVERMPELKKRLQENEYDAQISDTMTRSQLFELLNTCKCSKAGVQRINVLIQKRIDEARGK